MWTAEDYVRTTDRWAKYLLAKGYVPEFDPSLTSGAINDIDFVGWDSVYDSISDAQIEEIKEKYGEK